MKVQVDQEDLRPLVRSKIVYTRADLLDFLERQKENL